MTTVFISYGRGTQNQVQALAQDLESLGHEVWFDHELTGGQAWWDQVLARIRDCGVFVFALSPESLQSQACRLEYSYASDLDKIVLPVLIAEGVATDLLPPELAKLQYVDCRAQDKSALLALVRAFNKLPPARALPDPLPQPPAVPLSYLSSLSHEVESLKPLAFQEQTALLVRLKQGLKEPKDAGNVRALLKRFRARDDLLARVAEEIDELLKQPQAVAEAALGLAPRATHDRPVAQSVPATPVERPPAALDARLPHHDTVPTDAAVRGFAYEIGLAAGALMKYLGMVLAGAIVGLFVPALLLRGSRPAFEACIAVTVACMVPIVIVQVVLLRRGGRQKLAKRWLWLVPLAWVLGTLFGNDYDRAFLVPLFGAIGGALMGVVLLLHAYVSARSKPPTAEGKVPT